MAEEASRTPPGAPDAPTSTMDDLLDEMSKYRPVDVLGRCRGWSLDLGSQRDRPLEVQIPPSLDKFGQARTIVVAPYAVALIARLSLLKGSPFAIGRLDEDAFKVILRIVAELDDPALPPMELLLRTWNEQAWYQRDIKHAIGRGLMWYREIPKDLVNPGVDVPSLFERHVGMTVDDFFGLAFLLFSIVSAPEETPYQHLTTVSPGGSTERAKALLASDQIKTFLDAAAIDQDGFRELAREWSPGSGGYGRYDFNPLIERPLIAMGGSGYVAPIPDLLIWMVDEQPYWRLRKGSQGDGADQPFATFFGKEIFERYIGALLSDRMPTARLLPESATMHSNGRSGPDWIVVDGEVGIGIEAVLATIRHSAHDEDELEALTATIERDVAPRASKMPQKIEELKDQRPDLGLDSVMRWHRLIVTKTPLPWISLIKPRFVDPLVDPAAVPFHVMSIEEFESLMAAEENYGVADLLNEAETTPEPSADFRELFARVFRERQKPFTYGRLKSLQSEFFDQFLEGQALD